MTGQSGRFGRTGSAVPIAENPEAVTSARNAPAAQNGRRQSSPCTALLPLELVPGAPVRDCTAKESPRRRTVREERPSRPVARPSTGSSARSARSAPWNPSDSGPFPRHVSPLGERQACVGCGGFPPGQATAAQGRVSTGERDATRSQTTPGTMPSTPPSGVGGTEVDAGGKRRCRAGGHHRRPGPERHPEAASDASRAKASSSNPDAASTRNGLDALSTREAGPGRRAGLSPSGRFSPPWRRRACANSPQGGRGTALPDEPRPEPQ